MPAFGIERVGPSQKTIAKRQFVVQEGKYRGGVYHLVQIDLRSINAALVIPSQFKETSFLQGWNQALPQGRMTDISTIKQVLAKGKEFQAAGKASMEDYVCHHPLVCFISDATNFPFNEGHFAISEGKILPLPPGSHPITGKHHILQTAGGKISFPVIDTDTDAAIRTAEEGFFVPKIIHEGQAIRLLDEVPSTGRISISDFRGHIGQIFIESDYSEMGSQKRAEIHLQLLEYLRNPKNYSEILNTILSGQAVGFGQYGKLSLPLQIFNHTYWIETASEEIYCLKTYPSPDGKSAAGVTFNEGPDLLFEVAREYDFEIRNAFIGTNGKDVRIIQPENNIPEPIRATLGGASLGDYLDRPLANFIAFSCPKLPSKELINPS